MKFTAFWVLAVSCLLLFFSPQAHAIQVDLSKFEIDPTVTLGSGNSSATIAEDSDQPWLEHVGLRNSSLDIPIDALSLSFDYELVVAPYNDDYFDFYFGDNSAPSESFGGYNTSGTENLIYAGTISKDLKNFAGNALPFIAFALSWDWYDGTDNMGNMAGNPYASKLIISNVAINPVPEPATLLLLGSGLLGIIGFKKRKISGAR